MFKVTFFTLATIYMVHCAPTPAVVAPVVPLSPTVRIIARLQSGDFDPRPQYTYAYTVDDATTGDSKHQIESRDGDVVRGQYSFLEADGSRRTVDYTADDVNGFRAVVNNAVPVAAVAAVVPEVAPVVATAPVGVEVARSVVTVPEKIVAENVVVPSAKLAVATPAVTPIRSARILAAPAARFVSNVAAVAPVVQSQYIAQPAVYSAPLTAPLSLPLTAGDSLTYSAYYPYSNFGARLAALPITVV